MRDEDSAASRRSVASLWQGHAEGGDDRSAGTLLDQAASMLGRDPPRDPHPKTGSARDIAPVLGGRIDCIAHLQHRFTAFLIDGDSDRLRGRAVPTRVLQQLEERLPQEGLAPLEDHGLDTRELQVASQGLRTAPRDALIAEVSDPALLGRSFAPVRRRRPS